ncbi:hypothetical protein [Acaryochloris sp. CCMEE 5410]|uniref:hypothetical protein n=1 Tax=Acaryochloris sp. CCMEE 5410 TaxID=310037 RepID=UPI0021D363D9|nr:hypothetical protein [Acaryochloris sp. CCMEE 5410]
MPVTLPHPLQLLAPLLSPEHLAPLLALQQHYPEGLLHQNWPAYAQGSDPLAFLLQVWREQRPESEPPAPIWKCDASAIEACPHISTLVNSIHGFQSEEGDPEQWLVAAWWWGTAAVVCRTSADKLENAIAGWYQRYRCAVLYLQSPEMEQDAQILNAYEADLTCSHSLEVPKQVDLSWAIKDGFDWGQWQLPSALQPWGSQAELGQTVIANNPAKTAPSSSKNN